MPNYNDAGKLVLRLTLGGLMLFHGIHKIFNFSGTMGWLGGTLAQYNLPEFVAYGVFVGEVIAPILIILGLYSRIGGVLVVINMLFALCLVHIPHGEFFTLGGSGAWAMQAQAFFLLTAVCVTLMGPGRYSINRN